MATNTQLKEKYEGKVFPTKRYGDLKILKYNCASNIQVEFINSGYKRNAALQSILVGSVKDKSVPNECGVGIIDIEGAVVNNKATPAYRLWTNMLQRCYNQKMQEAHPAYKDCEVSEDFKYYSKFKAWAEQQTGFNQEGWHLDKDILIKGNKVYSEDTCCFVPAEINCLMTNNKSVRGNLPQGVSWNCTKTRYRARIQKPDGWVSLGTHDTPKQAFIAYKVAKEVYIKEVANKWKDQLDHRVYQALINWQVEIAD